MSSKLKKRRDEIENKLMLSHIHTASSLNKRKPEDQGRLAADERKKPDRNENTIGWIKCKGSNLSLPTELFNKDYKLCKTNARDGVFCQFGGSCKKVYSWLAKLDKTKQKAIVNSVDADDTLSFINVDENLITKIRNR